MLIEKDFFTPKNSQSIDQGSFCWSSPSNIALVKYWGKIGNQLPANPSISFTLNNCKTITKLDFVKRTDFSQEFSFDFSFEGKSKEEFRPKIINFFERIKPYCPFLVDYHFTIDSQNTFPHSSGIASSASSMAALALTIMSIEKALNPSMTEDYFYKKSSFLARLGSGSACRSIKGEVVIWGEHQYTKESSNLYGIEFLDIHPLFKNYQDTILLIDKGEKQVSSTVGHDLMHNHPYAKKRFEQAHTNLTQIKEIIKTGDINQFIKIVESEALTLHSMMMTSMPYFILMKPNTLQVINKIWDYRRETNTPVCFTLDAGANVHVLYPEQDKEKVIGFINNELVQYCQNSQYICDNVGVGAQKIL